MNDKGRVGIVDGEGMGTKCTAVEKEGSGGEGPD